MNCDGTVSQVEDFLQRKIVAIFFMQKWHKLKRMLTFSFRYTLDTKVKLQISNEIYNNNNLRSYVLMYGQCRHHKMYR